MSAAHENTERALSWSVATAAMLAVMKLIAGLLVNSMALLSSALDSAMDVASSLINFMAARVAAKPPDEHHAYGHGKVESLASLFQSLAIGATGIFIMIEAVKRLIQGSSLRDLDTGIGVMAVSLIATIALVVKLRMAQKETGSLILSTESLHYTTDILSNGGALLALLIVRSTGFTAADVLFSIGASLYIFKTSFEILRTAVDELVDRSLPGVSKEAIALIIAEYHPCLGGLHNFRSRKVGKQIFLDFHVEIKGEQDFKKAHLLTEGLIDKIHEKYPGADVTVHYDPEGER